jgi:hypothetical protein
LYTSNFPPGVLYVKLTVEDVYNTPNNFAIIRVNLSNLFKLIRQKVIASLGGTVSAYEGTEVIFEPDSIYQDDYVAISIPDAEPGPNQAPTKYYMTSIMREVVLENATNSLKKPVTIKIPYQNSNIVGMNENYLKMFYFDNTKNEWVLISDSSVNTQQKYVSAKVSHFSIFRIGELSQSYIQSTLSAANGGIVTAPDGTQSQIPPHALKEDDVITIQRPISYSNEGIPRFYKPTSIVREFILTKPANASFNKLVTIRIPFLDNEVIGMKKENLRICWWNNLKNKWQVVNTSKVLLNENKVEAQVSHFSIYRIFEYVLGEEIISEDTVYTYPNPATGDSLIFKCYLGDDADITIDIFNISGQKIATLTNSGIAGCAVETKWDITNIASGVYIYKLEAKTKNGRSKYVIKKLAIVH